MSTNEVSEESTEIPEHDLFYDITQFRRRIMSSAKVTHDDYARQCKQRKIHKVQRKELPPIAPGPLEEQEILLPKIFLSSERHSGTTPEDLSKRWGLSVAQAALTLKATTRKLFRSALMPLARRYRVDRMFQPNRLQGTFATDTMDMRCKSIHGE